MHALIELLLKEAPVVTDGSWGTQLQKRGLSRGECPDMWNLSNPDRVREVAALYVNAGSRIILTNTFGANRFVLGKFQAAEKVVGINGAGVKISKDAAAGRALVFASIGPSGKMLVSGDVTEASLAEAFEEQASALSAAGADGIVVETMMDINEAVIAVRAAKATGLPVIASMVYDSGKAKDRTMMGNTPEHCAEALAAAGADAIGANCGQGIEGFIPVCKKLNAATALPLWMKPNAGLPEMVNGEVVYRTGAEEFARHVPALLENGACFLGGCCGTGAEFITEIRRAIEGKK
ncbi:MAG: homocysteine S-methyltransferase family protein [Spirochaetes bacterium]|jgi:methionine synthase I (cobalamin-dependent)|nr:homocysteine S-methyltransferase family protein [Spirochaetota bacterium]